MLRHDKSYYKGFFKIFKPIDMKFLKYILIWGLVGCNFNVPSKSKLISGKIDRIERARLGKGYYKATYYYSFNFLGETYQDSSDFYLGDSKMQRLDIGDDIQIKVEHNKKKLSSEFLESNFKKDNQQVQCFSVGQYTTKTFEELRIFNLDNGQYKLISHLYEKGPILYGWNKVFIKRGDSKAGKYFALENCEIVNGEFHIKSNEDNINHKFIITDGYLIHMFGDVKEIYYFME